MSDLIKTLCAIIVLAVLPITASDWYFKSGFLDKFMLEQSLPLMGTILAIYIAASASFLAILMAYEHQSGQKIFQNTCTELKQNICFITVLFLIHFILLTVSQSPDIAKNVFTNPFLIYGLKAMKVFTFSVYIYALYELNTELFGIRDKLTSAKK